MVMRNRSAAAITVAAIVASCVGLLEARPQGKGRPRAAAPWQADNGDGTYSNPVIFADYSDPDAIRVGDDFYLTASSFNCVPGLPILHSRDLVNWTIIGHALPIQPPAAVFCKPQHGGGVWAPALRHHQGHFYIFYGDPDFGVYMVKAKDPAGPWTEPHLLQAARGWIDPCPFWDDDGNAYLVRAWARSRSGIQSIITLHRLSPDGTRLLDTGVTVFDGRAHHPTIEGPKLYKRGGYYYIFAPAGGVRAGWQTVLRSKNILGPYLDRIVLDQGRTEINGPHQGAWVELASGESWFVHFQDRGPYGRVTHLQPLKWVDDWPVIGADPDGDGKGEPVLRHRQPVVGTSGRGQKPRGSPGGMPHFAAPQTGDEFNGPRLSRAWQWHANPDPGWSSFTARRGWLKLLATPLPEGAANLWSAANLLLQKLPGPAFTATTRIDFSRLAPGSRAGLLMMGADYSYIAAQRTAEGVRVIRGTATAAERGTPESLVPGASLTGRVLFLRITVREGARCDFAFSRDGRDFQPLGEEFVARDGRWIGAKVGLFASRRGGQPGIPAHSGAEFDWFRLEKAGGKLLE